MSERRRYPRHPIRLRTLVFRGEEEDAQHRWLRDISMGGLFIEDVDDVSVGDSLRVEVVLYEPGDPINIWLEGEVVRQVDDGVGIRVTAVFQESLDQLRDLLQNAMAPEQGG